MQGLRTPIRRGDDGSCVTHRSESQDRRKASLAVAK